MKRAKPLRDSSSKQQESFSNSGSSSHKASNSRKQKHATTNGAPQQPSSKAKMVAITKVNVEPASQSSSTADRRSGSKKSITKQQLPSEVSSQRQQPVQMQGYKSESLANFLMDAAENKLTLESVEFRDSDDDEYYSDEKVSISHESASVSQSHSNAQQWQIVEEQKRQQYLQVPSASRGTARNSLLNSMEHDSEYNLAISCNSSPEHKIHTVVAANTAAHLTHYEATSMNAADSSPSHIDILVRRNHSNMVEQPLPQSPSDATEGDFTPKTPVTITVTSAARDASASSSANGSPVQFDIASYTNGNMAELMEDEAAALQREKAEFMYQFEGAMSVIQETEEPDDLLTRKNSTVSSSLMITRVNSIHTPIDRMSKDPMPNRPNEQIILSPKSVMVKYQNCELLISQNKNTTVGNSSSTTTQQQQFVAQAAPVMQRKSVRSVRKSGSKNMADVSSFWEDSFAQMREMESVDDATKPETQMLVTQTASQPKQMGCLFDSTSASRLQNFTKDNLPRSSPKKKQSNQSSSPKRSKNSNNSSQQLKSYLQRQQEFLKNTMVPQENANQASVISQHKVYRSPERPCQPKNFSHFPSAMSTSSALQEREAQTTKPPNSLVSTEETPTEAKLVIFNDNIATNQKRKTNPTSIQSPNTRLKKYKDQTSCEAQSQKAIQLPTATPSVQSSDVFSLLSKPEEEADKYNRHLEGLNKSIVNMKDEIKNRSVTIYKDVKALNNKMKKSNGSNGASLEEKMDSEFLERMMHVYAFFTSCLNLVLQNNKEAHKLLILQPMIEKHITELKLDQLAVQANASDFFEPQDQTLSSIGLPSFNTSYASVNCTVVNQLNNKSVTPKRGSVDTMPSPKSRGGLTTQHKLIQLETMLQIATKVLQLNSLKHKLMNDNRSQVNTPSVQHKVLFTSKLNSAQISNAATTPINAASPDRMHDYSKKLSTKVQLSAPSRSPDGGQSPMNIKMIPVAEQTPAQLMQQQSQTLPDQVYYQKAAISIKPQQSHEGLIKVKSPGRRDGLEQVSTLESSKVESMQSPGHYQHRRHWSDGQLSSPRSKPGTNKGGQQHIQSQYQLPAYYPVEIILEKPLLPNTMGKTYSQSSAERPTQDSKQTPVQQNNSKQGGTIYCQNSSFGVMNSSAGSASRNAHQAYLHYQQQTLQPGEAQSYQTGDNKSPSREQFMQASKTYQGPSFGSNNPNNLLMDTVSTYQAGYGQDLHREQASELLSMKDNAESFMTVLHSSKTHADNNEQMRRQSEQRSNRPQVQFSPTNREERRATDKVLHHNQELACDKVEMDSHGQIVSGAKSQDSTDGNNIWQPTSKAAQYASTGQQQSAKKAKTQRSKIDESSSQSQPVQQIKQVTSDKMLLTVAKMKSMTSPTRHRSKAGSTSSKADKPSSTKAPAKTNSVRHQNHVKQEQLMTGYLDPMLPLSSGHKIHQVAMSRNMVAGTTKTSKTTKTWTMTAQSVDVSDMDMSSVSQATVDQFEVTNQKAKQSVLISGSHMAKSKSKKKKKLATTQSSYLASFNESSTQQHDMSTSHRQNSRNIDKRGLVGGNQSSNHYQSCQVLPESKIKKVLKGVISAQEAYLTAGTSKKATPSRNSLNSSTSLLTVSRSTVTSPRRTQNSPRHSGGQTQYQSTQQANSRQTMKKNASAKFCGSQKSMIQEMPKNASLLSPQPEKRRMSKMNSQQVLQVGNNQSQRNLMYNTMKIMTEPSSPSGEKCMGTTNKKKMSLQASRQSNYLLKQSIIVNTDKLLGPQNHQTMVASGSVRNVLRQNQSPPKSLSQAFSAISKAISRRQSQSSPQREAPSCQANQQSAHHKKSKTMVNAAYKKQPQILAASHMMP